jgi:signal transduction histidine kinase
MQKTLIEEGFNRRYVLLPMLLAIGLVVLGFWVTETRRAQARQLVEVMRDRQEAMRLLAETNYKTLEAESAQRGYMLTGEDLYLQPMESGLDGARGRLNELAALYSRLDPEEVSILERVAQDLEVKAGEMQASVEMVREGQRKLALEVVKLDMGLYRMHAISEALSSLRERELDRLYNHLRQWVSTTRLNTVINVSSMLFTILVLLVLGLLASRDIRRRENFAALLSAQIDARTAELRDLSQHMSRVAEAEKHALARELHDELGGLLVAMRMDLAQLRKRLAPDTDPELLARWARVEEAMAQGLELKRRVIEDLRPTLLDNMGLFTALRWMAQERAQQARLELRMEGLDDDIDVPPETAIAVFRTAQEAVANIVKHAGARRFALKAQTGERLTLEISDDGVGLPEGAERRTGSHGLRQMRFRMEAMGGELLVVPGDPRGTKVILSVALAGVEPQSA